jgi:hypothetical protein
MDQDAEAFAVWSADALGVGGFALDVGGRMGRSAGDGDR